MKKDKGKEKESMLFPCDFTFKIVGRVGEDFETHVMNIIRKHFPEVKRNAYESRLSKEANYIALTVTVQAKSRAELDSTYEELSSSPHVIMAL